MDQSGDVIEGRPFSHSIDHKSISVSLSFTLSIHCQDDLSHTVACLRRPECAEGLFLPGTIYTIYYKLYISIYYIYLSIFLPGTTTQRKASASVSLGEDVGGMRTGSKQERIASKLVDLLQLSSIEIVG